MRKKKKRSNKDIVNQKFVKISRFSKIEISTLVISLIAIISSIITPISIEYFKNKSDVDLYIPGLNEGGPLGFGTYRINSYNTYKGLDIEAVLRNNGNKRESVFDITCHLLIDFSGEESIIIFGDYSPKYAIIEAGSFQPIKMNFKIDDLDNLLRKVAKFKNEKIKKDAETMKKEMESTIEVARLKNERIKKDSKTMKKEMESADDTNIPTGMLPERDNIVRTFVCVTYRIRNKYYEVYRQINFLNSQFVFIDQMEEE